jgi:hypothetical protein
MIFQNENELIHHVASVVAVAVVAVVAAVVVVTRKEVFPLQHFLKFLSK